MDTRRPHNLRVIGEDDPDYLRLRGLRNDAESYHSQLARTLLPDRAMSLGWRRGQVENYCFCPFNNALTEHRAAHPDQFTERPAPWNPRWTQRPRRCVAGGEP